MGEWSAYERCEAECRRVVEQGDEYWEDCMTECLDDAADGEAE